MPTLSQVNFTIREQGTTVLEVVAADGETYEVKIALMVPMVLDTGFKNPIDGMPMFNIPANAVVQVKRPGNG